MFNIFPAYFMYKEEEECLHYVYKCYCSPCEQLSLSVQSEHLALHCLTLSWHIVWWLVNLSTNILLACYLYCKRDILNCIHVISYLLHIIIEHWKASNVNFEGFLVLAKRHSIFVSFEELFMAALYIFLHRIYSWQPAVSGRCCYLHIKTSWPEQN